MFVRGQKISGYEVQFGKRVDETVCNQDIKHGDWYMVKTGHEDHVIIRLETGESSEKKFTEAVNRELIQKKALENIIINL